MLLTYWKIGGRISEQELGGSERAKYDRCFPDEQIVNACVHNLNFR